MIPDASPAPTRFEDLPGVEADDAGAAWTCFRLTAAAILSEAVAPRPARRTDAALHSVCRDALDQPGRWSSEAATAFFATRFVPHRVLSAGGGEDAFFTGYYEPVVDGALARSADFTAPLLARPDDLKTFAAEEPRPAWAADLAAARTAADGTLSPSPDRAAIEAAIGSGLDRPIVWLRDWVEVFLIHVQGSARVRLPDGGLLRVTYAGRNGHPYTSIGRLLVEAGEIAPATMSLAVLKDWLRRNGQEHGQPGRSLMQRNASYIYFAAEPAVDERGPTGGAGVPLTPLRSIAVDRALWCYGLPFWVDATLPWQGAEPTPFRRLMIAQDTGSAIVGPARADLFFGSGEAAGRIAGDIRHHGALTVLRPRPLGSPP